MSDEYICLGNLASLKSGVEATIREKYPTLTEGVQVLKDGYGGGLPDWDDDSPIIASGKPYKGTNTHWEITEKGTFRWVIDYESTSKQDNNGQYASSNQISVVMSQSPEIIPFLPKIRQVYVPDGITQTECHYMVNCERVRFPNTLTTKPMIGSLPRVREMDMSDDIYANLNDYRCANMYALEKVTLSPLTTIIPQNCFERCCSLKDISLENVTEFKSKAFYEAFGLNIPIIFNASLANIAGSAFGRTGLTSVTFQTPTNGSYPTIANNAFEQCIFLKDIYVPWAEGEVANVPFGAVNATIHYNSEV